MGEQFPRILSALERELLLWMLPPERPGYAEYRTLVLNWNVAAQGRRGEGNYILAPAGERVDNESPLPQVFAYGIVESSAGSLSVTLRERFENQLEFELQDVRGAFDPLRSLEIRRWTYSTWTPGQDCPNCGANVRTVRMASERGRTFVLAICPRDERIWVHDERGGVNHLIPLSNFYNELMLHRNIRDPNIALDARNLFRDLRKYADKDFVLAFRTYNQIRAKVDVGGEIIVKESPPTLVERLKSWWRGRT